MGKATSSRAPSRARASRWCSCDRGLQALPKKPVPGEKPKDDLPILANPAILGNFPISKSSRQPKVVNPIKAAIAASARAFQAEALKVNAPAECRLPSPFVPSPRDTPILPLSKDEERELERVRQAQRNSNVDARISASLAEASARRKAKQEAEFTRLANEFAEAMGA